MLEKFISMVDCSDGAQMFIKTEDDSVVIQNIAEVRQETIDEEYEAFLEIDRLFQKLDEMDSKTIKKV